jgi:hypothetical protein
MWGEAHERAEGLNGQDAARGGVVVEEGAVGLEDGLLSGGGQLLQQVAVVAEEDAQASGVGPDGRAVRDVEADIIGHVHAEPEGAFLGATGADASLRAGEGDEELVAAIGTADAGEAVLEVAALEEVADGLVLDRSPVAELAGEALGVDGVKGVEVFADEAVEVGFEGLAWAVDRWNDPSLQTRNGTGDLVLWQGEGPLQRWGGRFLAMIRYGFD